MSDRTIRLQLPCDVDPSALPDDVRLDGRTLLVASSRWPSVDLIVREGPRQVCGIVLYAQKPGQTCRIKRIAWSMRTGLPVSDLLLTLP